ncbi:unnamed protein product [Rotaria sordida]|uniref:Transmembrane protein n=1 Tax=Rotaria sordida TaxID=392033 RepID=A0A814K249_9BILA|nr:unnamed protein product [Rotaria sordida]
MIRLYFVVIISILIIIPHTVNTFFLQNVSTITVPRNLSCRLNNNQTSPTDFQLCAIRFYSGLNQSQELSFTLYNGLRYMNTFRRFIQKNCNSIVNMSQAGTGAWSCGVRLPFESYTNIQICVCANNNCNDNIDTCRNSLTNSMNLSSSVDFIPNLTSIIQCNDTLNAPYICTEHSFINVSRCQDYIRNTSVLCAITIINSMITQRSLIYENYETYLSEKVYEIMSNLDRFTDRSLNETATKIYYRYNDPSARVIEECACTNSLCNQNITICASQIDLQVETTASTFPSMHISSADFTTQALVSVEFSSMSNSHMTVTNNKTATDFASATVTSTTTTFSASATAITNFTSTTITATTTTSLTSATINATTATFSVSATTTTSMTTSSRLTTVTEAPIIPSSSTQQNSVQGETGLGSAATAGLACGIIFSAVIFTSEIIFFKFFYSGAARSGFDPSVTYQCNNNFHIKINSIKYFYNKYNCTFILNDDDDNNHNKINICSNQSSCFINFKSFSFFHIQNHLNKCHFIKLKYIRLNYSCINDKLISINILTQSKKNDSLLIYTINTILICLSIIIFIILLVFIYSYIQHSFKDEIQQEKYLKINDIENIQLNSQSIYQQEYESKILSLIKSSSSSTLTSLNNQNTITNTSEYDNLTKDTYQSLELELPFKVKFYENYQLK